MATPPGSVCKSDSARPSSESDLYQKINAIANVFTELTANVSRLHKVRPRLRLAPGDSNYVGPNGKSTGHSRPSP